jgi:PPK2 family polyphosphate:nucleotide phosphotransferase
LKKNTTPPGKTLRLDPRKISPQLPEGLDANDGKKELEGLTEDIGRLQELMYSASTHAVLVLFQGMDTSGKDGTIRKVFQRTDPLGCQAVSFKSPTETELAHDFLWRVHAKAPPRGHIGLFNRSHYEDVLIARVRSLVDKQVWEDRYKAINDFEHMLTRNRTIVLKFFLHIDLEEQERRLLAREREVEKSWKLTAQDWRERKLWDAYMAAYADALSLCHTEHAPWTIVPSNKKWYRNLIVARAVHSALKNHEKGWQETLAALSKQRRAEIKKYRQEDGSS